MSEKPTYEELEQRVRELERAESERKENTQLPLGEIGGLYHKLIDFSPLPFLVTQEEKIVFANPAAAKLLGTRHQEEITGSTPQDWIHPDFVEQAYQRRSRIIETGEPADPVELTLLRQDKKEVVVLANATRISYDESHALLSVFHDITERKRAEKELKSALEEVDKEKRTLDAIMDYIPIGITIADENMRLRRVSRYGLEMMGWPMERHVGLSVEEILNQWQVYESDGETKARTEDLPLPKAILNGEIVLSQEIVQRHIDGRSIPLTCDAGPIRDSLGRITGGVIAWQDMTERKQTEEALRESEEKYRRIYENSVVGFFQSTPEGRFLHVNPAFAKMLGYESPEELVSCVSDIASQTYVTPEDRTRYHNALQVHGYVEDFELKVRCKDGSDVWLSDSSRAEFDEDGKTVRYEGIVVDISVRKRAEHALKEKTKLLQVISDNMFDLVSLTDMQGNYKFVGASHNILGYDLDWLIGRNVLEFIHPEDLPEISSAFNEFLSKLDDNRKVEYRYRCADGGYLWFETVGRFIRDDSGNPREILFSTRDVTQRKKHEETLQEREAFIKTVMDNLPIGVAVNSVDPTVEFSYMNDNFPKIYRITREALEEPDTFWDVVYEDSVFREKIKNRVEEDVASGDPDRMYWEDVPFTRDGEGPFFICARNIPLKGKKVMISTVWDVTDRILAEEALRESRDLLDATQRLAEVGGWVWDVESQAMTWTDQTYRIHGFDPGEVIPGSPEHIQRSLSCYDPDDRPVIGAAFRRCVEEGVSYDLEFPFTSVGGQRKWVQTTAQPVFDGRRVVKVIGNIVDITERKQAEEALRESERRFQKMLGVVPDMISIHSPEMDILYSNWQGFAAVPEDRQTPNTKCYKTYRGFDKICPDCQAGAVLESRKPLQKEVQLPDGTWVDLRAIPVLDQENNVEMFMEWVRDITEQKQAEEALRASEERYRRIAENMSDVVFIADLNLKTTYVSPSIERLLGESAAEHLKRPIEEKFPPESLNKIYNVFAEEMEKEKDPDCDKKRSRLIELEHFRPDGGTVWISVNLSCVRDEYGNPIAIQGVTRDITELKRVEDERGRLQEQLYQAQKMEAIGSLAGGVAHDLNNLLSPILGYGEMLRDDLDPEDIRRESVDEIIGAGLRARDLVRQLLAFSRKQILEFIPLNLNKVAAGLERLLRYTIREDIEMEFDLTPDVGVVMADIGQIEQVIMNLSVNAADAMPEGGELTIETRRVYLDEEYANHHTSVKTGEYIMLAVSDSGVGMDEATRERIFDPFFSTKGESGTGLGLATVYGIVKQHGGNIWVYSEPGKGSTFKVYLPVVETSEPEETTSAEAINDLKGSETILIVEDSDQVRRLAESVLKRNGYQVLTAKDGVEALEAMATHDRPVNLLLTDVVLPGMNGRELYEKASEVAPSMKVLFMSGYTDNVIAHRGVLDEGIQFIQKPFTVYGLAVKVREVLDEKPRK